MFELQRAQRETSEATHTGDKKDGETPWTR